MKKISLSQLQKTLSEVNALFSRGNIEASEKILNELAISFPSHPEILSKLGTIYLYQDKLNDGIQLIKKSLGANPYQPDVLNNFAVALLNNSQSREALDAINKAIQLKPDYVDAYYHQGLIYKSLGLHDDALKAYQRTIKIDPSHENAILNSAAIYIQFEKYNDAISILINIQLANPSAGYFYNLGLAHLKLENFIDAYELFNQAIQLKSDYAEAYNNQALALNGLKRFEEALQYAEKAILINNKYAEAYNNKGLILNELKFFEEALIQIKLALELAPSNYEIFNNLGNALNGLKLFDDAINNYDQAIKLNSKYADAYYNRGLAYQKLYKFEEALLDYNEAIALNSKFTKAFNNRGLLFKEQLIYSRAIQDFICALQLNPLLSEAHINLSIIYLLQLNFAEGWIHFEQRQRLVDFKNKSKNKIYLDKMPEDIEPILLIGEEGLGDQIIYLSLLHEIGQLKNKINIQIDHRLVPLFQRSFPAFDFFSYNENCVPDSYKYQALLGSLPRLYRNSKEDFINQKKSFLVSNSTQVSALRKKILLKHKYACGIAWKSKNEEIGAFKSASLIDFLPILQIHDINFIDLQYGETLDERKHLEICNNIKLTKIDGIDNFNDIDGLASLIDACDFIVTISNVTAHIAGALGKKVFLIVPYETGKIWYWHDGLNESLWYPTIQIFMQTKTGEWIKPINEIKKLLVGQMNHE